VDSTQLQPYNKERADPALCNPKNCGRLDKNDMMSPIRPLVQIYRRLWQWRGGSLDEEKI